MTSRRIMAAASTPALSGESADIVRRDRDATAMRVRCVGGVEARPTEIDASARYDLVSSHWCAGSTRVFGWLSDRAVMVSSTTIVRSALG